MTNHHSNSSSSSSNSNSGNFSNTNSNESISNQFINYSNGYPNPPPMIPAYGVGPMYMANGMIPPMGIPIMTPPLMNAPLNSAAAMPMNPDSTGYFGNISSNVSDDVISAIIACTGGFKRLKRPVDPSTGKPKNFALVEYETVQDLGRACRLLQDFLLDNRNLTIKLEQKDLITQADSSSNHLEDLKIYEQICRVLIGKKWTSGGSMEWLENRINRIKKEKEAEEEEEENNNKRGENTFSSSTIPPPPPHHHHHHRQRNYNDLVYEEPKKESSSAYNSTKERDSLMALRERERRWEAKVKEFERELRRDLEKDEERRKRHAKEAAALADNMEKYDDSRFTCRWGHLSNNIGDVDKSNVINNNNSNNDNNNTANSTNDLFYVDREKWKILRGKALQREQEIFAECLRIRSSLAVQEEANKIDRIRRLIETQIPTEKEEIFAYPVDWGKVDFVWFGGLCRERTCAFFSRPAEDHLASKVADFVAERIKANCRAADLMAEIKFEPAFLAVSEGPADAEFLLALLWRWIIYQTLLSVEIRK